MRRMPHTFSHEGWFGDGLAISDQILTLKLIFKLHQNPPNWTFFNVDCTDVLVANFKPRIGHYGHVGNGH